MNPASDPHRVVVDASFVVALCAKEPGRFAQALEAVTARTAAGCKLYAPHLLAMEALYALCKKQVAGTLTAAEYPEAVGNLELAWEDIQPPLAGDASLIAAAERIREGYGCSRSADSMYIALAEQLAESGSVELLTFDAAQARQAAAAAPSVTVTLLASQE